MIRLVFLLRRKADLSLQEFHERWRNEHGPLVASHQTRIGCVRYTQTHRIEDPSYQEMMRASRGPVERPYDGVAEVWWESEDILIQSQDSHPGKRAMEEILRDEAEFIDLPNSPIWLAHEYPQVNASPFEHLVARPRSSLVKGHMPIRHHADMSLDAAQLYWRTVHGPVSRQSATAFRRLAYQQVHRYVTPLESELRAARGTVTEPYTGHAEYWYDRAEARHSPDIDEAVRRQATDEGRFIDFARSCAWVGKESVFVDRW